MSADPTRESDPFVDGAEFGQIEFAYYLMASAAGLEMAECRLLREGPRTHFMTRRFDRGQGGERIHMQTLCGLAALDFNLAGAHSYAQYLQVIGDLGLGPQERSQALRRVVFNVAAVNRGDHTKNLSFLLPEGGDWKLGPAYDVTHAHNPDGVWTNQHQMSVNSKRIGISRDDLYQLGDLFGVPGYRNLVKEVLAAVERWPEFAEEAGVGAEHIARVGDDIAAARPL